MATSIISGKDGLTNLLLSPNTEIAIFGLGAKDFWEDQANNVLNELYKHKIRFNYALGTGLYDGIYDRTMLLAYPKSSNHKSSLRNFVIRQVGKIMRDDFKPEESVLIAHSHYDKKDQHRSSAHLYYTDGRKAERLKVNGIKFFPNKDGLDEYTSIDLGQSEPVVFQYC